MNYSHLPFLSTGNTGHAEHQNKKSRLEHSNIASTTLPPLEHVVAKKQPVGGARMVTMDTTLAQQQVMKGRMRRCSHMTQHLGVRFKTDAHTRSV